MRQVQRNYNLDLLRASAILMVVIYHVSQRWPIFREITLLRKFTDFGEYGVDLFFVLSGWLIGISLYKESIFSKASLVKKFLLKRILRVCLPYYPALAIAYMGVYFARGEVFDWGYLLFIQNFYHVIPFFLVSWSLCVELHFYIIAPLLAKIQNRYQYFLFIIILTPSILRVLSLFPFTSQSFGYYHTATFFKLDGILIGFSLAYIFVYMKKVWFSFESLSKHYVTLFISLTLTLYIVSGRYPGIAYYFMHLVVSLLFGSLLISIVNKSTILSKHKKSYIFLSLISYSIYLTHTFIIEASLKIVSKFDNVDSIVSNLVSMTLCYLFIILFGYMFYLCCEKTSLNLRESVIDRFSNS